MSRLRGWGCVGLLSWACVAAAAEPPPLFTLTDPRGDDRGDGALVYPLRDDLRPGDLDLLSVSARPEADGTLFELVFARPIQKPGARLIDAVGATVESVAKLGFYNFNVDLYVDMDRVEGSGLTSTVPGRMAEVDPAHAWEKAIVLTPRPYDARAALRRMTRSAL
ncbi:MAG TPA: glucodextranase DOMON-like domain-containing protein, partial [Myxococcaceae bacterium]|nr:glucodextranase DOMON-like domain-containing protein [Myxococcaceae bacterium]